MNNLTVVITACCFGLLLFGLAMSVVGVVNQNKNECLDDDDFDCNKEDGVEDLLATESKVLSLGTISYSFGLLRCDGCNKLHFVKQFLHGKEVALQLYVKCTKSFV